MPAKRHSRVKTSPRVKTGNGREYKPPKNIEYDTWYYEPTRDTPKFVRYRRKGQLIHKEEVMFHPGHGHNNPHQLPHLQINVALSRQITKSDVEKGTKNKKEVVRKAKPFLDKVDSLATYSEKRFK